MTKILFQPNPGPQTVFLNTPVREVLYGGAASGGKTAGMIALPTRWFGNPQFNGIILRRTRPEHQEMIDRTKVLYPKIVPGANYVEKRNRWEFPSGATLQMGYAEHEDDILTWKSFEYSFIGFDELTSFTQYQYDFMFSRNRTPAGSGLPLQIRSATNPGGPGHQWVYERFVESRDPFKVYGEQVGEGRVITRQFIPATVFDNPMIEDRESYIAGMQMMDDDLRDALLYGKWHLFQGQFFKALPEEVPVGLKSPKHYTIRCMDYGFVDPSAVYWLVVYPTLGLIDIVGEIYGSGMTVDDLARVVVKREDDMEKRYKILKPSISVADPSMFRRKSDGSQGIADMLQRRGVWFEEANNDRVAGWTILRSLMHSEKIRVWAGAAPFLMKTMPTLQYHRTKKDDIRAGGSDHGADALRYGAITYFEHMEPVSHEKIIDPTKQDVVFDKIKKRMRKGSDPMLDYAAHLL